VCVCVSAGRKKDLAAVWGGETKFFGGRGIHPKDDWNKHCLGAITRGKLKFCMLSCGYTDLLLQECVQCRIYFKNIRNQTGDFGGLA